MNRPGLSVVVVRWRGGDETLRCLRSVREAEPDLPITLVDAGSGDGGAERLGRRFPEIRVEALEHNPGFSGAANHGIESTEGRFIALLNPDTELPGPTLSILAGFLRQHPLAAGAVPLLDGFDGSSQHRWQLKHLPTALDLALGRSGRPAFSRPPRTPQPVAQPAAAAWVIRREAWESLGGFDVSFVPAWWEDVDFCLRLDALTRVSSAPWNQAWMVVPGARVRHAGGSSVGHLGDRAFLEAYFGNLIRYTHKHHEKSFPAIRKGLRASLYLRSLLRSEAAPLFRELRREI